MRNPMWVLAAFAAALFFANPHITKSGTIAVGGAAHAQIICCAPPPPPPPPDPGPGGGGGGGGGSGGGTGASNGDSGDSGGHRGKWGTSAWVNLAATLGGHVILSVGGASPEDHVLWSAGSFLGSLAGSGPVGGGAFLALFQRDQGLIVKLLRPGGLRCQPADIGRVAGCKEWLEAHKPVVRKRRLRRRP